MDNAMNDDLALRVLARIARDPASHNQSWFGYRDECGTTFCFAGHTVVESGYQLDWRRTMPSNLWPDGFMLADCVANGVEIADVAAGLLELTVIQEQELFYDANDIEEVYDSVARFMNVAPEVLKDKVRDLL